VRASPSGYTYRGPQPTETAPLSSRPRRHRGTTFANQTKRCLYDPGIVMHSRIPDTASSVAKRWSLLAVIALVILTQAYTCQGALASPSVPAATISCQSGTGHDVVCEFGSAAVAGPTGRDTRRDDPGTQVALLVALVTITAAVVVRFLAAAGPREWAPRRSLRGRHRLMALCITRV
jgi:hypothetical protein